MTGGSRGHSFVPSFLNNFLLTFKTQRSIIYLFFSLIFNIFLSDMTMAKYNELPASEKANIVIEDTWQG